ncbi:MAG TPA: class I SAM-dependent methyltransferase [Pyrinomonadaceae bacterium]|nr:class I SAM-dependent methyltransferase [Pyrinomonadaceae bacterium]
MATEERFQGANVIDAGRLSPYWGEHAARYVFALPFVEGKSVLDIACGTGYGIGLMQGQAFMVTGVDVDADAAKEAKAECNEHSAVLLAHGLRLPFTDESFDVVTSFETLEHLYERASFLAELKRVLKSDGRLILSTPNANYTKPVNGKPSNQFHIFEYAPDELRAELDAHFTVREFFGQALNDRIQIPPFEDAQKRLSKGIGTQSRLFAWKVLNKMPIGMRERISELIWNKPFYPTEKDYDFSNETIESSPVLVAVCSKRAN